MLKLATLAAFAALAGCATDDPVTGPGGGGDDGKGDAPAQWCSAQVTCEQFPPSAVCKPGDVLRTYTGPGTCVNHTCVYAQSDTTCPGECGAGMCQASCANGDWDVNVVAPINDLDIHGMQPRTVLDPSGSLHVSSTEGRGDIEYTTNASGTWKREVAAHGGRQSAIALTSTGAIHIVFTTPPPPSGLNTNIAHAYRTAHGAWTIEPLSSFFAADGDAVSIVIDASDTIHVAFRFRTDHSLRHAYRTTSDTQWHFETVATGSFAGTTKMLIAPDGTLEIAGYSTTTASFTIARKTGAAAWTTERVTTIRQVTGDLSLALGPDGREQVAYVAVPPAGQYYFEAPLELATKSAAGTWATEEISAHGVGPALAVTPSGRQVVIYQQTRNIQQPDDGLWIATRDPHGAWSRTRVQTGANSLWSSAAVEPSGAVDLIYDFYPSATLRHARSCN